MTVQARSNWFMLESSGRIFNEHLGYIEARNKLINSSATSSSKKSLPHHQLSYSLSCLFSLSRFMLNLELYASVKLIAVCASV